MLPTEHNPLEIYLPDENLKILEQLSRKENKSIEHIIEEIIDKSLAN
tara:strand:- start:3200 stop:3340 length:141 start_codon:yes stop_codon:yes gene_type:complete